MDFSLHISTGHLIIHASVTVEMFKKEMAEAMRAYDMYVVCIDKARDEFEASLISLVTKAIRAYESRGPQLRHGIALDKHLTVILSQTDGVRPLCGIYFNLHSPYQKRVAPKPVAAVTDSVREGRQPAES